MSTQGSGRRSDEDFDREIRAHLEIETDQLVDEGLPADRARQAAMRTFGNVTAAREQFYEARRVRWVDDLRHDVRCAIRNLRRYPVAALVAVLSLAAGIGAATVTLTVRSAVFHRPPALYRSPDQISRVHIGRPDRPPLRYGGPVPAELYGIWRDVLGESIGAATVSRGDREVRTADRLETVPLRAVSPNLFPLVGVEPALGRGFSPSAVEATGPAPAVLSHRVWQRLFDGRADAVGQVVWIDAQPYTVVGVMPERFWFGETSSPIWTRLGDQPGASNEPLDVVIRRDAGVTPAMLEARLQTGLVNYGAQVKLQWKLSTTGMEGTPLGHQVAPVLPYMLGTVVWLTLLIACANVAGLMIAQWTAREHEIAIRASIGATRGRIVRSLLTESVVLSAIGGILGICATFALRGWVLRRGGDVTFFDVSIDPAILLQIAAVTVLTGIVAGIAPALSETRRLHTNPLRAMAGSDRLRQRWRNALVVVEIAVTVALLVEATAMVDGYQRARRAVMGFDPRPLASARVENPRGVSPRELLEAAARVPGVASVAAGTTVPFAVPGSADRVAADGAGGRAVVSERGAVSPGFFAALGVPLRAGRPFTDTDTPTTRTAIVNETLAMRLFDGQNAVGARIWIAGTGHDVVGVVADYSSNPLRIPGTEPRVFVPLPAAPANRVHLLLRAQADPAGLVGPLRRELRDVSAGTTVTQAYTVDEVLNATSREILVGTAPLVPLIAMATLLTAAGIYGVLAFALARRARELAVRVAIGAKAVDLVRVVASHAARLVAIGALIGVAATFGLSRVVRAGGGAGSVFDPPPHAFVLPVVAIVLLAALASWIPSRRALKVDPVILLRAT